MAGKRYLIVPLAGAALAASAAIAVASTGKTASMSPMGSHMYKMAVAHAEVTVGPSKHYGRILYDKAHLVLYMFAPDHMSMSTCYGTCAKAWPPMLTKGAPRVAGLNAGLLGTTRRHDGTLQVTYGGHPLYYWSGDTSHTIMCQHVKLHGGYWYVVKPNGKANMAMGMGTMGSM
jgi:predicted lipoprotein with Yx(FWY)xxD motif